MSRKRKPRTDLRGKPRSPIWPQATRARAVELYRDRSAKEVFELTGVPQGTIRAWAAQARQRDGGDPLPNDATPAESADWAAKKEAAAVESFAVAQEALAEVRRLIAEGEQLKAQRAALTFAITTDKSGVLEAAADAAEERKARIVQADAQLIVEVIAQTLTDLGLPAGGAKKVVAHYLKQAANGTLSGPAPGARDARRAVYARVRAEGARRP